MTEPASLVRTVRIGAGITLPGVRQTGPQTFDASDGSLTFVLHPPMRRSWTSWGALERSSDVEWGVDHVRGGVTFHAADPAAELDLVRLDATTASAFRADSSSPSTVIGSFQPLGGPSTIANFLVGGAVLDTHEMHGRRCPSEQTALSIYRIARKRGGAFWESVARHIADWCAWRALRSGEAGPPHGFFGGQEVHQRILVDGLLLMQAELERSGDRRFGAAADRLRSAVQRLSTTWRGAPWYLHDGAEQEAGRNDLVLNTHLHAAVGLLACGEGIEDLVQAARTALSLPNEGARGWILSGAMCLADRSRSLAPNRWRNRCESFAYAVQASAARSRARRPHLRLPVGHIARDATPKPVPAYLTVNLNDLAVLVRNGADELRGALESGIRYARATGYFTAEITKNEPAAVLVPTLLRNAGYDKAARRYARRLMDRDVSPALGWPDHLDCLWSGLAPGTP